MKKVLLLLLAIIIFAFIPSGCSKASQLPEKYINDQENFKKSIILLNEARDLSNPPGSEQKDSFTLSNEIENEIFSKTEEGINFGKQINDEYLDYLHPELKYMFQQKLIKGAEIWYEGIKENNSGNVTEGLQKQIEGDNLDMEWINWWNKHGKEITNKVFE